MSIMQPPFINAERGVKPPSHGGCTLEEVAAELGVSVQRARQIEVQALRKLRFWCRRCGWDYHLLMHDQ